MFGIRWSGNKKPWRAGTRQGAERGDSYGIRSRYQCTPPRFCVQGGGRVGNQLELFRDTLPARPYATDELGTLAVMERAEAIERAYVTPNRKYEKRWIVFDVDRPGALVDWQEREIAAPNIAAMNRDNGHAHLFYGLTLPVHTDPEKYGPAIRYAAAVEAAYRDALDADLAYSGFLAKNPLHARWLVQTWQEALYDLDWLADFRGVNLKHYRDRRTLLPGYGIGRNCDLFDRLRRWSYRAVLRGNWPTLDAWQAACRATALGLNDFAAPLDAREVYGIAKSVARWTWARFSDAGFARYQAKVGKLGQIASAKVRGAKAESKRQMILDFQDYSTHSVARITGIPRSTVIRLRRRGVHLPLSGLAGCQSSLDSPADRKTYGEEGKGARVSRENAGAREAKGKAE